nr:hypothetical protein [Mangrovactinospora gilvigrisea]
MTNPTGKPATGRIRSGFLGHDKVGSAMSRADIAAFLVSQLTDTHYRRAMPPSATEPWVPVRGTAHAFRASAKTRKPILSLWAFHSRSATASGWCVA